MLVVKLSELHLEHEWGADDPTIDLHAATAVSSLDGRFESISLYFELAPGTRTGLHTDSVEETIYVVAGEAELRVGDEVSRVAENSLVVVHPGLHHDVRNVGETTLKVIGFFCGRQVDSVFEQNLSPRGTTTFSLP